MDDVKLPYAGLDEAVREIVSRIVLQVEEEHCRHLTEELRLQSRQLDAYAKRIAELEARVSAAAEMHELVFRASHLIDAAKKCGLQARATLEKK